jgi:hypothetical protein
LEWVNITTLLSYLKCCLSFGTIFIKFQYASDFRLAEICAFFDALFPDHRNNLFCQTIPGPSVFWGFACYAFSTGEPLV